MLGYGYDDVSALRDMFDGGGAGQAGDEFEGGGILSLLANLLASPYGSQRQDEREAVAQAIAAQGGSPRPRPRPRPEDLGPSPDYRGSGATPATAYVESPSRDYRGSGATPATAYVESPSESLINRSDLDLLPGAFEPESQVPTDLAGPRAQPQADKDARVLADVMAGDATSMRTTPVPAAPEDDVRPGIMAAPAANAAEAETALNMIRNGLVSRDSSAFLQLAERINQRGTPEQREELSRWLTSAADLSRGGNSPLAAP